MSGVLWLAVTLMAAAPDAQSAWLLSEPAEAEPLLPKRLLSVSEGFLGTAYLHSPLGEGDGVDPDPRLRFDAVDCLTFVEQTIALGLSKGPDEVLPLLNALRYEKAPSYADRNHLMEAQWLPNNVNKGFLRDVTREYGGADTVRTSKLLTAQSWASRSSQELGLPKEKQLLGAYELEMIPLAKVMDHARRLADGTILVVIREDQPRKVTRITHLGFVVQKKKRTYLRHAARSHYRKVVDEDLETFLLRNSKYSKWPVSGVALYQVRSPAPPDLTASSPAGQP